MSAMGYGGKRSRTVGGDERSELVMGRKRTLDLVRDVVAGLLDGIHF